MTKEMTPWFPSRIKPVHVGVYEVKTPGFHTPVPTYAQWDGYCWGYFMDSIEKARLNHPGLVAAKQDKQWRGFKEKQA